MVEGNAGEENPYPFPLPGTKLELSNNLDRQFSRLLVIEIVGIWGFLEGIQMLLVSSGMC